MAGQTLGAIAPVSSPSLPTSMRAPHLVPGSTRTRRNHGAFTMGSHLTCVYSTRRAASCYGVTVEVGAGVLQLSAGMTPAQARTMAKALSAAADAAEAAQIGGAQ